MMPRPWNRSRRLSSHPSVETLPLNLVDTVTLQGAGYATTTIDAQNVSHTQGINAYGVVRGKLDGFTIQGCNNDYDRPVYFQWCSMDITRNRIMNNQAWQGYYAGGGVHISGGAPFVANDLIISNTSDACSGIFIDGWGYPVIENCTIATNTTRMSTSVWDGGALIASYSVPIIRNCIIWGNTTGNIVLDQSKVSNCDFQDGYMSGTAGCISADPQFVGNNDYHLGKASPCVNAGTNQAWMAGNTDLDGSRRVSNGKVDMGVYEVNTAGTVLFFH